MTHEGFPNKDFVDELATKFTKIKVFDPQVNILSSTNQNIGGLKEMFEGELNKITHKRP